ncbi:hypothetical protein JYT15_00240 [Acidimicrobium ferrooxidans]|nr:hypothetical protein [Acidimicrobium ferrooxidans]
MSKIPLNIRLDESMVERMDKLIPWLEAQPNIAALASVTRSTVHRLALVRGLELLEAEAGAKKRSRRL